MIEILIWAGLTAIFCAMAFIVFYILASIIVPLVFDNYTTKASLGETIVIIFMVLASVIISLFLVYVIYQILVNNGLFT